MDYELAKELKEAEFSAKCNQKYYSVYPYCGRLEDSNLNHNQLCKDWDCKSPDTVELPDPTLSELIEACGHFYRLEKVSDRWSACTYDEKENYHVGSGATPEIAVAHLWLALNKK